MKISLESIKDDLYRDQEEKSVRVQKKVHDLL